LSRSYVFSQQGRPGREAPVSYSLRAVALARRSASGSDTRATLETDTDRAVRCNEQPGSTERQGPLRSQVAPLLTFSWVWCDHSRTVARNLYPGSVAGVGHFRLGRLVLPEHEPSYLGLTYLVTSTIECNALRVTTMRACLQRKHILRWLNRWIQLLPAVDR